MARGRDRHNTCRYLHTPPRAYHTNYIIILFTRLHRRNFLNFSNIFARVFWRWFILSSTIDRHFVSLYHTISRRRPSRDYVIVHYSDFRRIKRSISHIFEFQLPNTTHKRTVQWSSREGGGLIGLFPFICYIFSKYHCRYKINLLKEWKF